MATELFLAERLGIMRRSLRRFTYSTEKPCPVKPRWGHEAETVLDEVPDDPTLVDPQDGCPLNGSRDDSWPHDDPRWPTSCACGYVFEDEDHWQFVREELFRGPGGTFIFQDAPPGAMLPAPWFGPDSYQVVLPDGSPWITTQHASHIDGTLSDHGWQVSGTPPKITVRPSIWANVPNGWHGFITEGIMEGVS